SRNFKTKSKAMRQGKEKYYDRENSDDQSKNYSGKMRNKSKENTKIKPTYSESNLQHIAMNKVFISAAFVGSILMVLGYSWGPEGCEDSTIFEGLGKILIFMSLFGAAVNIFTLFVSFSDKDFDSAVVRGWGLLHALCWFAAATIASEALLSDAWCNGNGPSYDIGAGF
ncbi:MAG: hypothetical protein VXX17_03400, partial [Candidatus Thermoplasmatota archaeon]|nr:hypothetical protein [Candidatus Thermoplasmatota archaeon]